MLSAYKQKTDSNKDWEKSFTYNIKKSGPRREPCDTTYFNGPASVETLSVQNKYFQI